jgi:hypothetical protein
VSICISYNRLSNCGMPASVRSPPPGGIFTRRLIQAGREMHSFTIQLHHGLQSLSISLESAFSSRLPHPSCHQLLNYPQSISSTDQNWYEVWSERTAVGLSIRIPSPFKVFYTAGSLLVSELQSRNEYHGGTGFPLSPPKYLIFENV